MRIKCPMSYSLQSTPSIILAHASPGRALIGNREERCVFASH